MAEKTQGFDLAGKLKGVSNLDIGVEGREQIEYIDIGLIDPDPNNRKELKDIPELAETIAHIGIQQPLRLRIHPDDPGRYMLSVGHRRTEALRLLVNEGLEQFQLAPCIVDRTEKSDARRRLELIQSNLQTQALTPAEFAEYAHEVEMCLYQMQRDGEEFPGKMRDHVAKACKTSASELARLKVIREKLVPAELTKAWEKGTLKVSVAYVFAKQPPEVQRLMIYQITRYGSSNRNIEWWSEKQAKEAADRVTQELKPRKGPEGSCEKCDAAERRLARLGTSYDWDNHCKTGKCCHGCPNIGTCEHVCTHLSEEVKEAKAAAKSKRAADLARKKKEDEPHLKPRIKLWKRFGEARKAAGLTWEEYAEKAHVTNFRREKKVADFEQGEKITMSSGGLPYCGGDGFDAWRTKPLIAAADALGVSIDYLLCRTDEPRQVQEITKEVREWRSRGETPPEDKEIVVYAMTNDGPKYTPAVWDGSRFHAPGNPKKELTGLAQQFTKWTLLPEDE